MYAQQIEGESWVGEKIDQSKLQKMSGKPLSHIISQPQMPLSWAEQLSVSPTDEQIQQLYELMQAIKKHHNGEDAE